MKFKKIRGKHNRRENGREVHYASGDIIEATEEELRIHDPKLVTWEKVIEEEEKSVEEGKPVEDTIDAPKEGTKQPQITRVTSKTEISMIERGDSKGWDVIGLKKGKIVKTYNDEPLTEEEARKLVEDFSK
jgi:hypothetical protein